SGSRNNTGPDDWSTYIFSTKPSDTAGNTESAPSSPDFQLQVLYDTTAPVTTDDAPSGWRNSAVTVTLSPTDSGPAGGVSGVDKKIGRASCRERGAQGVGAVLVA